MVELTTVAVPTTKAKLGNQLFALRLLSSGPRFTSRHIALEIMGRAYAYGSIMPVFKSRMTDAQLALLLDYPDSK